MPNEEIMRPEAAETAAGLMQETTPAIGPNELKKFMKVLHTYKAGKAATDRRIIASEQWWKLRNTEEEQKETEIGKDGGFTSKSGWLHNVIVSKHADAMESFPQPVILPREEADKQEAELLSAVIPCILEHNKFEETYSDAQWQKMKTGTGVYKVVWDSKMLNGLGDIRVENVNLLNLYWQPGVSEIQKSRYFFQTEMVEKEVLYQTYPDLEGKLRNTGVFSSRFLYDDAIPTSDYVTVIEVYYHKHQQGKKTLHYCKFVGDQVLFATENETEVRKGFDGKPKPAMALVGLYDHGKFPYVFDPLFPIEGSPCGYGFVDLCRNPQTEIDIMKTSFVKNAMVGSIPRYFANENGDVKAEDFLDLSKPIIPVNGSLDETRFRRVEHISLDGNYLNLLQHDINELRETSGNTETSTGTTNSGVTAAAAIAALQEASGKGSRDSTKGSWRAYEEIVDFTIELDRQFYDMPRHFRIVGQDGNPQFKTYSNAGLQPQPQNFLGQDMGMRKPVFDIKISAQKKNIFTTVSQNQLALDLFKLGFFNPQLADQAVMCLSMMEFEGKTEILNKISQNGLLWQKLQQYMQMALSFAQVANPAMAEMIAQDIVHTLGEGALVAGAGAMAQSNQLAGGSSKEDTRTGNARARAAQASQPA